jgi:hypothetical protein
MAPKSLQWLALVMLLGAAVMALAADPSREEPSYGGGLKGNYGRNYANEDTYDSPYPGGKVRASKMASVRGCWFLWQFLPLRSQPGPPVCVFWCVCMMLWGKSKHMYRDRLGEGGVHCLANTLQPTEQLGEHATRRSSLETE